VARRLETSHLSAPLRHLWGSAAKPLIYPAFSLFGGSADDLGPGVCQPLGVEVSNVHPRTVSDRATASNDVHGNRIAIQSLGMRPYVVVDPPVAGHPAPEVGMRGDALLGGDPIGVGRVGGELDD
jgi:hypothetical protein